jgi:hypothetical protein
VSLFICYYADCCYDDCCYADCCYADCCYADCCYAECRYAECRYAECRYAECRGTALSSEVIPGAIFNDSKIFCMNGIRGQQLFIFNAQTMQSIN